MEAADMLLNRYRVIDAGEGGGFGQVIICWDTRLQRRVAIKRMPLGQSQDAAYMASSLQEALGEARVASMLAHPNIVGVFDFELDEHFAYLVMEYVDGLSLEALLRRVEGGNLTAEECAYLIESVASALAFAHENGVLHLDIKPSNIMIDKKGSIKLCDFGMSSLQSAAGYGDSRGGTVGFMPPEQIVGDVVDERADIFSFACVIWQALTGRPLFWATSAEDSLAKIEAGPKRPLKRDALFDNAEFEMLLREALAPDVIERPGDIKLYSQALLHALGVDPKEGRQSLLELMSQTTNDEEEGQSEDVSMGLPLSFRYPWLEPLIKHGIGAVVSGALAYLCAPSIFAAVSLVEPTHYVLARLVAALALAAISAFLPRAGAFVAMVMLPISLLIGATSLEGLALPFLLLCIGILSFIKLSPYNPYFGPAFLTSAATGAPVTALPSTLFFENGYLAATLSSAASALFGLAAVAATMSMNETGAFAPEVANQIFFELLLQPAMLVIIIIISISSLICTALIQKLDSDAADVAICALSSAIAAFLPVLYQVLQQNYPHNLQNKMDISNSFLAGVPKQIIIAVLLGVFLCVVAKLIGRLADSWE